MKSQFEVLKNMPSISHFKCDRCRLKLPSGWGTYFYAEDNEGNRVPCPHPCEWLTWQQVLPKSTSQEQFQKRTGYNSFCICLDCSYQFEADFGEDYGTLPKNSIWRRRGNLKTNANMRVEKDKRVCPKCKSTNVKTELEMVGEMCPKCKKGSIIEIETGWIS